MDEITRAKIEEWFRYADDLGLSPFFHDRAGAGAPLVAEILIAEAVEIPAPTPPPMPKIKLDAQKLSLESTFKANAESRGRAGYFSSDCEWPVALRCR
jgi:hypothetical protein